jgi:hypothetical protein
MREANPVAVELEHVPSVSELDVVDDVSPSGSMTVTEGDASAATATSVSRTTTREAFRR